MYSLKLLIQGQAKNLSLSSIVWNISNSFSITVEDSFDLDSWFSWDKERVVNIGDYGIPGGGDGACLYREFLTYNPSP